MLEFVGVVSLIVIGLAVAFFVLLFIKFGASHEQRKYISAIDDAGVKLTGDEAALINAGREVQQVMETQDACIKSLARSGEYTAEQWDDMRDELAAVWDTMPGEYVAGDFYNHAEIPDDPDYRPCRSGPRPRPHVTADYVPLGQTSRRIACDSSIVPIKEDENGEPLSIGRRSRTIPPPMRRALRARDQGCRFPGCINTRFVDGHHIKHWADGGARD